MRRTFKPIVTLMTALTVTSFTLGACTAETDTTETETEGGMVAPADGADLTGAEITEAVPGVEAADPEGDTSNTADLEEPGNAEYSDVGDPPE